MNTFSYILLALALALESMLLTYRNTKGTALRLTTGLAVSLIMAFMQALLFQGGVWLGNQLRFDLLEIDKAFFFAMYLIVALKLLLPMFGRKRGDGVYNLMQIKTMLALAIAASVNALLLGVGSGFVEDFKRAVLRAGISVLLAVWLLSYLGIMLGRRDKALGTKRWKLIEVVLLVVLAITVGL